ncbi:hypothetical protein [Umezawaea sp. Da 62-37]|uniref:hypothetical protein n=1 Tax=Umezawaea sp. Da 62-37 TaxID=3075927 RepID=UPI0028F6F415|nr:hypothetical protein [Umezawaea sp. Da 62-37]WNV84847.1 hypothetical protein RM788_42905 [Umezawaea sp. Da 62-37]
MTVARYFDEVVDQLTLAGIDVTTMDIDISFAQPMRGQLLTDPGTVLRWREDLGWSTGRRSTGPSAHPTQVAGLLASG